MFAASRTRVNECADALRRDGYVVVDSFFELNLANALRAELLELNDAGCLSPNRTQLGNIVFSKPHIQEADLHDARLRSLFSTTLRHFAAWCDESSGGFARALCTALPELRLATGDAARAVKLQVNAGGGCFPWHYDNPGPPSKRALTMLVYLNPGWVPSDGGELVVMPFLTTAVTVAPLHNRCVMFVSDRCVHRVLPARTKRLMMTTWFDGAAVNSSDDVGLNLPGRATLEEIVALLRDTGRQRSVSRAVYAEEYAVSMAECMQGAEGQDALLRAHAEHLDSVQRNGPLRRLVDLLRSMKPGPIQK
jgi:hypothetical protein